MIIGVSSVQYAVRVHSRALIIPRADGNAGFQKSMRDDLLPVAGYCSDRSAGAYTKTARIWVRREPSSASDARE